MLNNLKDILKDYHYWTQELISRLNNEEYEEIVECIEKRQECIEKSNKISYSRQDFNSIASELCLEQIEVLAMDKMSEKRAELRIKIEETSRTKNANRNYNKNIHNKHNILNKRI